MLDQEFKESKKKMIKIMITEQMREEARSNASKIRNMAVQMGFKSVFQTSDPMEDHFIGYLGEIVFRNYLIYDKIQASELFVVGEPDQGDFLIGDKVIDVKTGHRKYPIESIGDNFKFLITKQVKEKDIYVSILINNSFTEGYLMGFIEKERLNDYQLTGQIPHWEIPMKDLKSMEMLK